MPGRVAGTVFLYMCVAIPYFAFFQWTDYHAKGAAELLHIVNPRCIEQAGHHCLKLASDTANLPWDAAVAAWIGQRYLLQFLVAMMILVASGAAALSIGNAISKRGSAHKIPHT